MSVLSDSHLYSIAGNENDKRKYLMKDGFPVTCFNIPPYAEVSSMSQKLEYKRIQCSTECPHASMMVSKNGETGEEKWIYLITCSANQRQFRIATQEQIEAWEKAQAPATKSNGGLIIT
jgi:hypothetical protein